MGKALEPVPGDTSSPSSGLVGGNMVRSGAAQMWLQRRPRLTLGSSSSLLGTQSAWLGTTGSELGQERAV